MTSQCQSLLKIGYQKPVNFLEAGELVISEDEDDQTLGILISQIDYIRNLSSVETVDEFHAEIMQILTGLGFSDYALICKTGLGTVEAPHSSLPPELFKAYEDEGYCRFDMVLDYIHCGIGDPILLSMVTDTIKSSPVMTYTFKKNEEILALYNSLGVSNAYIIPVRSTKKANQDRGVLTVMAIGMDDAEFRVKAKRFGPLLKVLADAISYLNEHRFNHIRPENEIKPKALRLLSTMAKCYLSLAEAADDLCISLDTANKHMALAKQALGTGSQAHAVYLAIRKGLIQL
jgi:DNA-binding CsgD family transcriptional regulator